MNRFPQDFESNLTGFGGDPSKNKEEHRQALEKTPVILVHGNAANSVHPKWGMETMASFLTGSPGYKPEEIWAMDYLGEGNTQADLNDPHRNHIVQLRTFIDRVRDYLGVQKLDFIAHSLGCGMVNGYIRGLQSDASWNSNDNRLGVVGTFVSLAGATYGLGLGGASEFRTGSDFEQQSHKYTGVDDDTPDGAGQTSVQESPVESWKVVTRLDKNDARYVAITSVNDFVDAQNRDTGRREGANLNARFDLGGGIDGHEKIIKSQTVFNAFKSYLNQNPPVAPAVISVDKDNGSYGPELQITVSITPATLSVSHVAERIIKKFNAGYIDRTVAETKSGALSNGQSLTLAIDGEWDVMFRAAGAEDVQRTYGVNVILPQVQILTEGKDTEWSHGSLSVEASTTRGTLYYSTDREHWFLGHTVTINRTTTVSFIAIDSDGIASPVVSRAFVKPVTWTDKQTATLTQHFIAGRLSVDQYVSMGLKLGFNAAITLYLINGQWTLNPDSPETIRSEPEPVAGLAAPITAASSRISLRADKASGKHVKGFDATITAAGPAGEPITIYYTQDGTDPSDRHNHRRQSFGTRKTFTIRGQGHHSILCYVQDSAGHGMFESFAWSINEHRSL